MALFSRKLVLCCRFDNAHPSSVHLGISGCDLDVLIVAVVLQLTKALQSKGYEIVAACRKCSSDLSAIPSVQVVEGRHFSMHQGAVRAVICIFGGPIGSLRGIRYIPFAIGNVLVTYCM